MNRLFGFLVVSALAIFTTAASAQENDPGCTKPDLYIGVVAAKRKIPIAVGRISTFDTETGFHVEYKVLGCESAAREWATAKGREQFPSNDNWAITVEVMLVPKSALAPLFDK
jgi:hypothetical protein